MMCGRFSFVYDDWSDVLSAYDLNGDFSEYPKRYNVAPGQMVPVIIFDGEKRRFGSLRWGLVPGFATDEKSGYKMINAKAETLTVRPAFRHLLARKRCLILADGFFEWKKTDDGKQPMRITLSARKLFAFAGLYDTWTGSDRKKLSTCTIITTAPNETMKAIHNRMPVILNKEQEDIWLSRDNIDMEVLLSLLKPDSDERMAVYPVSSLVNRVQNDTPECIAPVEGSPKGIVPLFDCSRL